MTTVKLVSGGIDSYIMSQQYDGINVYINFGQTYASYEINALKKLQVDFDIIKIESKFQEKDIYISNRNLMFASIVTLTYEPDIIMMAGLKDDNCKDKSPEAFVEMSNIISKYANKPVKIISPYFNKSKGDIIQEFTQKEKLLDTFSCYNPKEDGTHCGNCPACLRKAIALETNGIKCNYIVQQNIINTYLKKIHTYSQDRISRFFIWLSYRAKVQAIDIDGILCEETGPYKDRKPIEKNIQYINQLNSYIVLYTARLETDRTITEQWLRDHHVKYDALIMNKLPYSILIDDKTKII